MKKMIALVFIAILFLTGCAKAEPEQPLRVYSFHGENEQLKITNGMIVLSEKNDVFGGGDLQVSEDLQSNITSFSTTFYVASEHDDRTILSNAVIDQTGSTIHIDGGLGTVSGDGVILDRVVDEENIADLKNNLFFELTTTDADGKENVYQLQMVVSEIVAESEN